MSFFDRNRDKAMYVLISFSRNLTTRRFDKFIAHLRPNGAVSHPYFRVIPKGAKATHDLLAKILNTPKKHENDDNEQSETYASRRNIAPPSAVRPARQGTQECQDQKDHQDRYKHCFPLLWGFNRRYSGALTQRRSNP